MERHFHFLSSGRGDISISISSGRGDFMSSSIPPKAISGVNAIPIKPQWRLCFFGRNRKIHPKQHMECQETPNGGISLPDVKTDCTATAVKAGWSQNKDSHTDQRAQKETFEYVVQWFSTTVLRSFNGKRTVFLINHAGKMTSTCKRMKFGPFLMP